MSASVVQSAKMTGSTGTTSTATITAPAPGNTLLVIVTIPTASAPAVSLSDPLNGPWGAPDHSSGGLYGSLTCYFYRKSNIANAPTSLSVQGTTGSFAATFEVIEVAGLDDASPPVSIKAKTDLSGGVPAVTHTASITTSNANDFVLMLINSSNARLLNSADGGYSVVPPETVNSMVHAAYLADAGAVGAKSTLLTFSATTSALILGVVYKSVPSGPTVSTITGTTATEASAVVFTVTMSGTGGLTDAYSWSGTAGSGDYTQTLTDGMFTTTGGSGSVTVSGGNIVVPSAVTAFTVTVPTTGDTLDEANETIRLVFGGVTSSSGTINDDDAPPTITGTTSQTVTAGSPIVITYSPGLSGQTRTYTLALTDGTAVGGTDYDNTIVPGDFAVTAGTGSVSISGSTVTVDAGVTEFTLSIGTTA